MRILPFMITCFAYFTTPAANAGLDPCLMRPKPAGCTGERAIYCSNFPQGSSTATILMGQRKILLDNPSRLYPIGEVIGGMLPGGQKMSRYQLNDVWLRELVVNRGFDGKMSALLIDTDNQIVINYPSCEEVSSMSTRERVE